MKDTIPKGKVWTIVKGQPSVPKGAILEILGTLVVNPETDKEDLSRSENISRYETFAAKVATEINRVPNPHEGL